MNCCSNETMPIGVRKLLSAIVGQAIADADRVCKKQASGKHCSCDTCDGRKWLRGEDAKGICHTLGLPWAELACPLLRRIDSYLRPVSQ